MLLCAASVALIIHSSCAPAGKDAGMLVGVHLQACDYNFSRRDLLDEGSDAILQLGAEAIGVFMGPEYKRYYYKMKDDAASLAELARTPAYDRLFSKPFKVFSLTTYAFANGLNNRWQKGITTYNPDAAYREIRELTEYLLRRFDGSGKTFIIKNWEGDWQLIGNFADGTVPDDEAVEAMVAWLQARTRAVSDARKAAPGAKNVSVYSAVELNLAMKTYYGGKTMLTDVIPHTNADLYSYSSWDIFSRPFFVIPMLNLIKKYAPDSKAFGSKNVFIGEFGCPDGYPGKEMLLHQSLEAYRRWGVPYCFFWQLYDNECSRKTYYPAEAAKRKDNDCRGFWLIDKMGRRTPSWYLLKKYIAALKSGERDRLNVFN